jgi:hypothetical protein
MGIVPGVLGIVIGVLLYSAISGRVVHWGGAAFMVLVVGVVGAVRAALLWDRMQNFHTLTNE